MKKIFLSLGVLVAFSGLAVGQTSGQWLVQCSESLVKKEYLVAVEKCTKAIEAQPDSVEAFQLRASAYENAAYYSAAIGDYTSLIRLTKGAAKFHFYRAELYSKRIEKQKAIDDYTTVITKEPTGPFTAKAFYGRALIYEKVGRKPAAQADYWSAVKLDPGFAEAKKKIEYPFGDMTITQAADNIIPGIPPTVGMTDKGAETKPKPLPTPTPDILRGGTVTDATDRILADTFGGGKGEYDGLFDGKTTSSAATAVKTPVDSGAWVKALSSGTAKLNKKDYEGAVKSYSECLSYASGAVLCLKNRAMAYYFLKKYEPALSDIDAAIKISPDAADFYSIRAFIRYNSDDAIGASVDMDRAVKLEPENPEWYANRALINCKIKEFAVLAKEDEDKARSLGGKIAKPCRP